MEERGLLVKNIIIIFITNDTNYYLILKNPAFVLPPSPLERALCADASFYKALTACLNWVPRSS